MSSAEVLLQGPRLRLRPVRVADATERYAGWMNDPEVNRFLESRFAHHSPEDLQRFIETAQADPDVVFLALELNDSRRHIGNIKLGPINRRHRLGDIGLVIGEKDCWGQGLATEAIQLLVEHAFRDLGLHKLTASCYANNAGSERAFLKAGFVVEGVRKRHFLCDGVFVDTQLLGKINPAELAS